MLWGGRLGFGAVMTDPRWIRWASASANRVAWDVAGAVAEAVVLCLYIFWRPQDAIHSGNIITFGVCLPLLMKWIVNCEANKHTYCRLVSFSVWKMSPV